MGRKHRFDLKALDVIPDIECKIAGIEIVREGRFLDRHQRRQLLRHCRAHQRRGVVLDAVVGADQLRQADEVIVMGVGVEYSLDLVRADSQGGETRLDVGSGVDQVDPPLKHENRAHCRPVLVPAVAFSRMNDGEVLPSHQVQSQRIRIFVVDIRRQIQIDGNPVPAAGKFESVEGEAAYAQAAADDNRLVVDADRIEEFAWMLDGPESEAQLQPHHLSGSLGFDAGVHYFLF